MPHVRNDPGKGDHVQCSLKVDVEGGRIKLRHRRVVSWTKAESGGKHVRCRTVIHLSQAGYRKETEVRMIRLDSQSDMNITFIVVL